METQVHLMPNAYTSMLVLLKFCHRVSLTTEEQGPHSLGVRWRSLSVHPRTTLQTCLCSGPPPAASHALVSLLPSYPHPRPSPGELSTTPFFLSSNVDIPVLLQEGRPGSLHAERIPIGLLPRAPLVAPFLHLIAPPSLPFPRLRAMSFWPSLLGLLEASRLHLEEQLPCGGGAREAFP